MTTSSPPPSPPPLPQPLPPQAKGLPNPNDAHKDPPPPALQERIFLECRHQKGTTSTTGGDGSAPVLDAPASLQRTRRTRTLTLQNMEASDKKATAEFSVALSKAEIEADLIAMTGSKPRRHPKRHPKHVQAILDERMPGLNLPKTLNGDRYRISDNSH